MAETERHDLVELVAVAIYEDMRAPHEVDWPGESEALQFQYRSLASYVLALVRAEPDLQLDDRS
jgi:hypothetical protein